MKKILVIDDDPPVARLIGAALKAVGLECTIDYCSDGGQGRAKAAQGGYDLITLDLAMPLMNGVEALEEMKRNPKSAHIPVVVITGLQEQALHQRVTELGAATIIAKPFHPERVGPLLQQVLAGVPLPSDEASGLRPLGA